MIVSATTIDLGDGIANGLAAIAVIISVIALFVADSRAKDANEIALDANETSREARDIAKSAHQRTVEHYEHIESQDLERLQVEFKELTGPLIAKIARIITRYGLESGAVSNKAIGIESIEASNKDLHEYTLAVVRRVNAHQARHFLSVSQDVTEALHAYFDAYASHFIDRKQKSKEGGDENPFKTPYPVSVDEDHTGGLQASKENLSRILTTYYQLLFQLSYTDDYRVEMDRIPTILEALRGGSPNTEDASQTDSPSD